MREKFQARNTKELDISARASTTIQFGMRFSTVQRSVLYELSSIVNLSVSTGTERLNNELYNLIQRRLKEMSKLLIIDLLCYIVFHTITFKRSINKWYDNCIWICCLATVWCVCPMKVLYRESYMCQRNSKLINQRLAVDYNLSEFVKSTLSYILFIKMTQIFKMLQLAWTMCFE